MTIFLSVSSASVTPWPCPLRALRLMTWPRKVTKTVMKEISMVFAIRALIMVALAGSMAPGREPTNCHMGFRQAMTSQATLAQVEYRERRRTVMGQPSLGRLSTSAVERQLRVTRSSARWWCKCHKPSD